MLNELQRRRCDQEIFNGFHSLEELPVNGLIGSIEDREFVPYPVKLISTGGFLEDDIPLKYYTFNKNRLTGSFNSQRWKSILIENFKSYKSWVTTVNEISVISGVLYKITDEVLEFYSIVGKSKSTDELRLYIQNSFVQHELYPYFYKNIVLPVIEEGRTVILIDDLKKTFFDYLKIPKFNTFGQLEQWENSLTETL